ncbi:MAG: hypothetical protein A2Z18_08750 [Armatimonadetes bacterium RBG_16_58_9]|nr:MAG: hypothetical protein A2Z18_08750 [Armatimonadetes bacterium RBG_16_58_9]
MVATGRKSLDSISGADADTTLVARTKTGDVSAFGELVDRHQRAVYGIVSRMVDDRDDVDDIVQDVFVQAYRSIDNFRGDAAFSTWVYRIAVNMTIKQMKKIKARQAASIDDPLNGLADQLASCDFDKPERQAERKARDEALRNAIAKLPEIHQTVVVLHYLQNCTCDEIARAMGCSVGTVWSRLHHACKKLRGELTDWFEVAKVC